MVRAKILKELRIYSMSRSGQHAVMNWLMAQFEKNEVVYLNNLGMRGSQYQPDTAINRSFLNDATITLQLYMLSFEGDFKRALKSNISHFSNTDDVRKISIMRDPFNLFASKIKNKEPLKEILFDEYVFLSKIKNCYRISYNEWFKSAKYRRKILKTLDLPEVTIESFKEVSQNAGGSSFDKMDFQNKADEMKVLERYKAYLENPTYINFFKDHPELIKISKNIFDFYPKELKKRIES